MLGRLLRRLFGGRDRARPINPPPPSLPPQPAAVASPVPPPPPPPPPVAEALAQEVAEPSSDPVAEEPGRVRFILADGTMATPEVDPETEERLKYLVDNLVPPPEPPST